MNTINIGMGKKVDGKKKIDNKKLKVKTPVR